MARIIVLEFKITRRERHPTNIQIRVDRQVQEFQIPICDHQTWISIMAEHHVEMIVDTLDGDRRSTRHVEQIVIRVVGPGVHTIAQRLAVVLILEFEIRAGERDPTHVECGVYRQVQRFQISVGNHQARCSPMAEDDADRVVHALDRGGRGARHAQQVF